MSLFFIGINFVGLFLNMSLYTIDIYKNNGILDRVDSGLPQEQPKHQPLLDEPLETDIDH